MNLSVIDIALVAAPVALVGLLYFLLVRFRKMGMSRAVHYAFRVTLGILSVWGIGLLWMVSAGDGWLRLVLLP